MAQSKDVPRKDDEIPNARDGFLAALGTEINQLRTERKKTLKELAEMTELSVSYLSQIESGKANPGIEIYKKITEALGTELYRVIFKASNEMNLSVEKRNSIKAYNPLFKRLEILATELKEDNEDGGDDGNDAREYTRIDREAVSKRTSHS